MKKAYIHYIIAIIIGCIFMFGIKPENGLTELGVRVMAVIVPTLYLWLTVSTNWTCFMIMSLLVMTQAMTANEVWANSMGHFVFITIMSFMMLNVCLTETGVITKIAKFFITRDIVKGRPMIFLAMFFLSHLVIGFFVNGVSLSAIYIGIAEEIARNLKLKKGDPMYTALFLGIIWANALLAICSPIGQALPNLIMSLLQTSCGITITYPQWMAYGAAYSAVVFILMMIIMKIWNPDCSQFENFDIDEMKASNKPLDKNGKIATAVFCVVIFFVIVPTVLSKVSPLMAYISKLGTVVPPLLGIVALCLIENEGKPIIDFRDTIKKIDLTSAVFAGTVACLAVPIGAESTGITVWLTNVLNPMLGGLGAGTIVIVLILLAMTMTNFLSNTVTEALFFNIGVALLTPFGYNMAAFAVIIALASGMSTVTPSAAVPSPFFFAPGHVTMANTIKPNMAFIVMTFVVIAVLVVPTANMLF